MKTKHTPGPWYWHTDHAGNISLRTPDRGNLIVMDFTRRGMNGATARLAYWTGLPGGQPRERLGGVLDKFDRDHPDARLIAAAPELLEACKACAALCEDAEGIPYPLKVRFRLVIAKACDAAEKAEGQP